MFGNSQRDYVHALPKTKKPVSDRINLTFRTIFPVNK
jgi:alkylated DNA repair dioxygenase AlkB